METTFEALPAGAMFSMVEPLSEKSLMYGIKFVKPITAYNYFNMDGKFPGYILPHQKVKIVNYKIELE